MMANHRRWSTDTEPIRPRKGRKGDVRLGTDVSPDQKDKIITLAEREGVTMRAIVSDALDFYFDAVGV